MILLDTQAALWATLDKRSLSPAAAHAIRDASRAGDGVAIASSTLWEIAIAVSKGRIRVPSTLGDYLRYVEKAFIILPITGAIAERSVLFSKEYPRDPMDRVIGATAVVHGLKLITKDEGIRASKEVECIW